MKKLLFFFFVLTIFTSCKQKDNSLKSGDIVYIKPDSIEGVISTIYSSGQIEVYYQDSLGNYSTMSITKDSIWKK